MLVGDSVLISDNQSIKTVPAGKVKAIADTMPRPKLTLEKAAHGAAKTRPKALATKNGKEQQILIPPITHNTVKLHSTYGTDIYRSNRDRKLTHPRRSRPSRRDRNTSVLGVEEECATDAVRYGAVQNVEEVKQPHQQAQTQARKPPDNTSTQDKGSIRGPWADAHNGGVGRCGARAYNEGEPRITADVLRQLKRRGTRAGILRPQGRAGAPRQFIVDNMDIANPRGTFGRDIHAEFNLITCKPMVQKNLVRAISDRQQLAKGILVRQTAAALVLFRREETPDA